MPRMASREGSLGSRDDLRSPMLRRRESQKSVGDRPNSRKGSLSSPRNSPRHATSVQDCSSPRRGPPPAPPRSSRPDTAGPGRPEVNAGVGGKASNNDNLEPCEYAELPKLPLPPLKCTIDQLLDNLKPILSAEEFVTAESIVTKFSAAGGVGEQALQVLEKQRANLDNWAYSYWLDEMYMQPRLPLPVNSNPGMVFPRQSFQGIGQMLAFTSRIISGFTKFKQKLDLKALPQDKAASREPGQPLCMAQYYRVLTTYREPGSLKDRQVSSGEEAKENEHIMVARMGHWFKVPVKTNDKWLPVENVFSSLQDIWHLAERIGPVRDDNRVSYLTGTTRTKWAKAWHHLRNPCISSKQVNIESLQCIAASLLVVCLDEETQNVSDQTRSMKGMFNQMLTGGGGRFNGGNRWFDKTVQLVVCPDGVCGLCYEHSPSEGIAVVQLVESILRDLGPRSTSCLAYHPQASNFTELEWCLDERDRDNVRDARAVLDSLDMDNDLEVFHFKDFGKEFIKSCRCSPDSWIQMALQLTMHRLTGGIVPTYESASTRRYRLGRVDSIRASHPEASAWCHAMEKVKENSKDKAAMSKEARSMFEVAMKKQTKVMISNIMGNGLDIPLSGLREASKELNLIESQELFESDFYSKLNTFTLSTSQVPVGLPLSFMGYGAVVPGGYGVSYNPTPDEIIFCICSFHSCPETSSRRFAATLQQSLQDMQQLFTK